ISAEFDLLIDAAFKKQQTATEAAEVARFICALLAIVGKSAGCEIWPPNVTRTYVRPCNSDFAALVRRQRLAVCIDNENLAAGHNASHRQKRILFQNGSVNADRCCGHRCLSGTVHIPNLGLRKAVEQLSCGLRCECLTTKKKSPRARQHRLCKVVF